MHHIRRFGIQLLFTFAVVVIFYHIQQMWYRQADPNYGIWGAISMQLNIAAPVIILAVIVVLIAGWLEYKYLKNQEREYKEMRQENQQNADRIIKAIGRLRDVRYNEPKQPNGNKNKNNDKPK